MPDRAEYADVHVGQRHYDRAGQRCGINQVRRAKMLRIVHAVGKDQSSFRVGI